MDWIEANGVALRYELSGDCGPLVVLVHEMGGTLESWDGVMPRLRAGRRLLRYDTRGAGQSEKIHGSVHTDTMAADLLGLLTVLGIDGPVALVGCAVGAGIAMRFSMLHPERAAALVAMAPATGVPKDRQAATEERAARMETLGARGVVEESFANSYPTEVRHDLDVYRRFRTRWLANDPESYAAIYRSLITSPVQDELSRIACPTLLLAGIHDRLRPPAMIEPLASRIPGAAFRPLDTGHFMAVQTPDLVAGVIDDFLHSVGQ
jgi:3-oxoadipate enol-lactonase